MTPLHGKVAAAMALVLLLVALILFYWSPQMGLPGQATLLVATGATLKDSGLLDLLVPSFEEWARSRGYRVEVRYVAVGTGQALRMAERGDVDVVLVHAPPLEKQYLERGVLRCRSIFAVNFFLLVGPLEDPAQIGELGDMVEAFRRIAESGGSGKAYFVSRFDMSGTHAKELETWRSAIGREPDPAADRWYITTGAGMGQTLLVAVERRAYTLTEPGTWLNMEAKGLTRGLRVLVEGGREHMNVYSVSIVRPSPAASEFVRFLLGPSGQGLIAGHQVAGRPLFHPVAHLSPQMRQWVRDSGWDFGPKCEGG